MPPSESSFARTRSAVFAIVLASFVLSFVHRTAPAAIATELTRDFGIPAAVLGTLAATYFYVYTLLQIPVGVLADTIGPRKLLASGSLVAAGGSLLFALAPVWEWAAVGRTLVGVGVAVAFIAILKVSAVWYPADRFATLNGVTMFVGNLGAVAAGAPLAWLVTQTSWRAVFAGLANRSGLVGRNLMFHPYASIRGWFDDPLDGHRGPHIGTWSQQFYETGTTRGYVRGFTYQFSRGQGPVLTAMTGMANGRIPWGDGHHAAYRRMFDRSAGMLAICEDLPEAHNTVTLDPVLKDADGIPAPKTTYTLSENSRRMLAHAVARGTDILRAAGAWDVVSESPMQLAGWHLMGTARMGTDPKTSVVNEWGRCHDVKNLFIIDGSIFPTAGAVNPTNTIQALALHVADTMKKNLANLFE